MTNAAVLDQFGATHVGMTPLQAIRAAELAVVGRWFRPGADVLELGGGDGYQAKLLADAGCRVSSIDLSSRPSHSEAHFIVQDYSGSEIPFPDDSFDIVFSSNVLEHIAHLNTTLSEIRRVLRPGGVCIHLVPSATWRAWTSLTHGPWLVRRLFRNPSHDGSAGLSATVQKNTPFSLAAKVLGLAPHGEYPNAIAELYYFSRRRWIRELSRHRFEIVAAFGNGLFYTGSSLLPILSMRVRRDLSRFLGSSCHVFVLRPSGDGGG